MTTMTVREEQATDELVAFIRHDADLDDLARLYSLLFTDETVVVIAASGTGRSEHFIDGVLDTEYRTRQ